MSNHHFRYARNAQLKIHISRISKSPCYTLRLFAVLVCVGWLLTSMNNKVLQIFFPTRVVSSSSPFSLTILFINSTTWTNSVEFIDSIRGNHAFPTKK
mmetsp:Transcript_27727/g.56869  ORF Transcript_27727/g.56869 Transcript_27727/m.56869 type:complete len:98 (-) Transcript_27727:555-848(-)